MSLILRKNCQKHLNHIGLTSFYTDINDNKDMVVKTKCGKVFFIVKGISFSRKTPSKSELEYAEELFVRYLIENKKIIEKYIDLYTEVNSLEDVPLTNDNGIRISTIYGHDKYHYSYDDRLFRLIVKEGIISSISLVNNKSATFDELIVFELDIPLFNTHAQYFRSFQTLQDKKKELYDLANEMNTCEL